MSTIYDEIVPLAIVKDAIAAELGDRIGTYTFSSGATTPAIRIESGADPYPEEPQVTGLEVVLARSPSIALSPKIGHGLQQTINTVITLKQWDILETTEEAFFLCCKAIARMGLYLPSQPGVRVPRNEILDSIEVATIQYAESVVVSFI